MSDNEAQSNAAPQTSPSVAPGAISGSAGAAPDLVERLRHIHAELATENEKLQQQVAELRSALVTSCAAEISATKAAESAEQRVSELNMHQSLQDAATAAVMERAEKAERERDALRERVQDAEEVILRGVDIMTYDQVGQWAGVRGWLEQDTQHYIDAAMQAKEG